MNSSLNEYTKPYPHVITPEDQLRERIERAVRERMMRARIGMLPTRSRLGPTLNASQSYVEALEWVLTDVLGVSLL